MSMSFPKGGSAGGGGIGMGMGGGPKVVAVPMQNQAVLDVLVALTGQNFGFDQRAWKTWYATQDKPPVVNARRD